MPQYQLNDTNMETISQKLENKELLTLYQEQWTQIRHLDNLDFRTLTILPIVIGILTVGIGFIKTSQNNVPNFVYIISAIIFIGISLMGCYSTFRNWLCYMRRMSIISALENALDLVSNKIIMKSVQFNPPKTFWKFHISLIKSIRFPLLLFYAVIGGIGVYLIFQSHSSYCLFLKNLLIILVPLIIFVYSDILTFFSFKKEFNQDEILISN
jgi:hypothetical protein